MLFDVVDDATAGLVELMLLLLLLLLLLLVELRVERVMVALVRVEKLRVLGQLERLCKFET